MKFMTVQIKAKCLYFFFSNIVPYLPPKSPLMVQPKVQTRFLFFFFSFLFSSFPGYSISCLCTLFLSTEIKWLYIYIYIKKVNIAFGLQSCSPIGGISRELELKHQPSFFPLWQNRRNSRDFNFIKMWF